MGVTVTATESERDESENAVIFGRTFYASPRPFVSENSVRMSQQTIFEDDGCLPEANEQRKKQLDELKRKRTDLLNRQHEFAMNRNEAKLKRTEEVKEFDARCDQCQTFLSETQKTLDRRREENQQNQTNPEEVEAEIAEAEKEMEKESELLTADIEQYQLML